MDEDGPIATQDSLEGFGRSPSNVIDPTRGEPSGTVVGEASPDPEGEASRDPEGEASRDPEAEASRDPEAEASLDPEAEASPDPEAEASPDPEGEASPGPEAEASPDPEGEASPDPEGEASRDPEGEASRDREAEASPDPEGEASRDLEAEASPGPEGEASLDPEAEASPDPEGAEDRKGEGALPEGFAELPARNQFLERKALYWRLFEHYKNLRDSGEWAGARPDLKAMQQMNEEKTSIDFQCLGPVPGIHVGDEFGFRAEIFVVGLHRQVLGGIAWIEDEGEVVACSVVSSGVYRDDRDDRDDRETVIYTRQGGFNYKGGKRQLKDHKRMKDHKPERKKANKALLNTYKRGGSVRLIRGYNLDASGWNKVYTYDGLYRVEAADFEVGQDGHLVYTFKLEREKDQTRLGEPPIDIEEWKRRKSLKNRVFQAS